MYSLRLLAPPGMPRLRSGITLQAITRALPLQHDPHCPGSSHSCRHPLNHLTAGHCHLLIRLRRMDDLGYRPGGLRSAYLWIQQTLLKLGRVSAISSRGTIRADIHVCHKLLLAKAMLSTRINPRNLLRPLPLTPGRTCCHWTLRRARRVRHVQDI